MAKRRPNNPKFDPDNYPYAHCREQHVWQRYDAAIDKKDKLGYRVQVCKTCAMRKLTTIDMNPASKDYGRVMERRYRAPVGYRVPGGINWQDRGLLIVRNFLGEITEGYQQKK